MPAKSSRQRKAAGVALAAKRGKVPMSKLKGPAKTMAKMSEKDLSDFAKNPNKTGINNIKTNHLILFFILPPVFHI